MVIGNYEVCRKKGFFSKIFTKIFGVVDYHTHIRLKPIIEYAKSKGLYGNFLEIGCGEGIIAFELNRRGHVKRYLGLDMNENAINKAKRTKRAIGHKNVKFLHEDALSFLNTTDIKMNIDYVVLYDFIEHIHNPGKFLKKLCMCIGEKGGGKTFLVSVPTPNYPKVFGRRFHESVGHVIDGYTKKDLDKLFEKIGYKPYYYEYNTGLIGNIGAYIFYHLMPIVNIKVLFLLTMPFRILDVNSEKISSSLFVVYKKEN